MNFPERVCINVQKKINIRAAAENKSFFILQIFNVILTWLIQNNSLRHTRIIICRTKIESEKHNPKC